MMLVIVQQHQLVLTQSQYFLHQNIYHWFYYSATVHVHSTVLVIVRLSVRLLHSRWTAHGSTYDHDFFTIWQPHDSSFSDAKFRLHIPMT